MKYSLVLLVTFLGLFSCLEKKKIIVEPHLELGQKISFSGCSPDKTYIIIGYKRNYEGPVEKEWNNQDYIVFLYINDHNDVKRATIHKNSVEKQ